MATPSTLLDVLEERADQDPEALQYRYLHKGDADGPAELVTRAQLLERARALGSILAEQTRPGDRVLLLYPPGLDTFVAFFACLHADLIAVPMTPPDPQRIAQTLPRLQRIVERSGVALVLSTARIVELAGAFLAELPAFAALRWLATDAIPAGGAPPRRSRRGPDAVAFLQYTSGSLGAPKGVMVTNRALLANLEMIRVGMVMGPRTPGAFWLPHHHDMGFIGGGLEFVYCGAPCTMLSPVAFIQRPSRWLRAVSRFGAVVGGGPNFAYERCVQRVTDEEMEGVDLGTWRVAFTGAEPIRAGTLERFARRFERWGFRREFIYPCYGLAESTLFVTGKPMEPTPLPPRTLTVSARALEEDRVELVAPDPSVAHRTVVSSGVPRLDAEVAIVSRDGLRAGLGRVGEIWIRGPNLAAGYWDDAETTAATFERSLRDTGSGGFMATGDLGFVADGELFVTGRAKELLILGGRNHYPQDLEETIEGAHPSLRRGGSAAFSYELDDEEVLGVVAELSAERIDAEGFAEKPFQDVIHAIRGALLKEHGVIPRSVAFLRPQGLPKTTSGKKARLDARRRLLDGTLEAL